MTDYDSDETFECRLKMAQALDQHCIAIKGAYARHTGTLRQLLHVQISTGKSRRKLHTINTHGLTSLAQLEAAYLETKYDYVAIIAEMEV